MSLNICVFCGSHAGKNPLFAAETERLGQLMAIHNYNLVYGGANVGLMKLLAESYMQEGGHITGVIPDFLVQKHLIQPGLSKTIVVSTMQERKFKMAQLADAFIALPGGYGTLEELFEVITASQLSLHRKPIVIGNIEGFYDALLAHREKMIQQGFVNKAHKHTFVDAADASQMIEGIKAYAAPDTPKYIEDVQKKYNSKNSTENEKK